VVKRNQELAAAVVGRDDKLDAAERDIERRAIKLIALRQPMANDLRRTWRP
jgi:phosphate transport system protein